MISLTLSEDQAELLEYALGRAQRIEIAEAATCDGRDGRDSYLERARQIDALRAALDCALPEPDHR